MFFSFLRRNALVFGLPLLLTLGYNWAFFRETLAVYSWPGNAGFLLALALLLFALTGVVVALLFWGWGRTGRVLNRLLGVALVLVAAGVAYYGDTFRTIIDVDMVRNVVQTEVREVADLLTLKMVAYLLFLGVVPAFLLWRGAGPVLGFWQMLRDKVSALVLFLLLAGGCVALFSSHFSSFIREHKVLRMYANPVAPLYAGLRFSGLVGGRKKPVQVQALGLDARLVATGRPKLTVLVVGETVRADHWGLNGYARQTTPKMQALAQSGAFLLNLPNVVSCGTSTAVSVPCMFSDLGREGYSQEAFDGRENVLDVLARAGVGVLWRDNNSDSKGVAARSAHVVYEDLKEARNNPACAASGEAECRDEHLLQGLDAFLAARAGQSVLLVLHTMGSHGPAYFARVPAQFRQFTPVCEDRQLEKCSVQSIVNAYDNTVLYADHVLGLVQTWLSKQAAYDAAMLYMSDHGESLGEKGVYLHGMPYAFAPDAQKQVPALLWFADDYARRRFAADWPRLQARAQSQAFSHDYLFHTLLGMMEVQTSAYRPELDVLHLP